MIAALSQPRPGRERTQRRVRQRTSNERQNGPRDLPPRGGGAKESGAADDFGRQAAARLSSRSRQLLDMEIEFVDNPAFRAALQDGETACDALAAAKALGGDGANRPPASRSAGTLAALCSAPLLEPDEERELFRRMNYVKYHAHVLRQQLDDAQADAQPVELAEQLLEQSEALRNRIVGANLRLVVSMAKRFAGSRYSLDELIDEGIFTLMRAVEKFDFDRGFRFSTYAVRAIQHNLVRYVSRRRQHEDRFRFVDTESLEEETCDRGEALASQRRIEEMQASLARMLQRLDKRERAIVRARFALGGDGKVQTLSVLAEKFGVCKERVRQLEKRALEKLRRMAEETDLEIRGE